MSSEVWTFVQTTISNIHGDIDEDFFLDRMQESIAYNRTFHVSTKSSAEKWRTTVSTLFKLGEKSAGDLATALIEQARFDTTVLDKSTTSIVIRLVDDLISAIANLKSCSCINSYRKIATALQQQVRDVSRIEHGKDMSDELIDFNTLMYNIASEPSRVQYAVLAGLGKPSLTRNTEHYMLCIAALVENLAAKAGSTEIVNEIEFEAPADRDYFADLTGNDVMPRLNQQSRDTMLTLVQIGKACEKCIRAPWGKLNVDENNNLKSLEAAVAKELKRIGNTKLSSKHVLLSDNFNVVETIYSAILQHFLDHDLEHILRNKFVREFGTSMVARLGQAVHSIQVEGDKYSHIKCCRCIIDAITDKQILLIQQITFSNPRMIENCADDLFNTMKDHIDNEWLNAFVHMLPFGKSAVFDSLDLVYDLVIQYPDPVLPFNFLKKVALYNPELLTEVHASYLDDVLNERQVDSQIVRTMACLEALAVVGELRPNLLHGFGEKYYEAILPFGEHLDDAWYHVAAVLEAIGKSSADDAVRVMDLYVGGYQLYPTQQHLGVLLKAMAEIALVHPKATRRQLGWVSNNVGQDARLLKGLDKLHYNIEEGLAHKKNKTNDNKSSEAQSCIMCSVM